MTRQLVSSGVKWEKTVGYSRAVKVGPHVYVSGTVAVDERGEIVGRGDAYAQTVFILGKIGKALEEAGASLKQVTRTRMFVTDIELFDSIGRAHGEVFHEIRPAATMVEVSALVDPELFVEIEADAYIDPS